MKKTLVLLSTLLLLTALLVGFSISASAEDVIHSGTWGNLSWVLNDTTGELTISGSGVMTGLFHDSTSAWGSYKPSIKTVIIEDGVTSIGGNAFSDCSSLKSITIPNSVTNIGNYAFSDCSSLKNITIPNGVTSIGTSSTFSGCSNLTSITIPDGVTSIGWFAFKDCSSLTNITIPDSVTSIGGNAFWGCSSLKSITIPNSVTSIGGNAFWGCSSLKSITIPNSVTSIGEWAFYSCSSLTSITIPNSVTSIGKYAFYSCESLKRIVYCGFESDWISIEKGTDWDAKTGNYSISYHTQHTWNNGEITTQPTHLATGVKTFTCSECGETKTEVIEKLPTENQPSADDTTETTDKNEEKSSGGCASNILGDFGFIVAILGIAFISTSKKQRK